MGRGHLEAHFAAEWEALCPDLPFEREATIPAWVEWAAEKKRLGLAKVRRPFRADFLWRDARVVVEIQGATWAVGAHSTGSGIERDAQKALSAAAGGWIVVPITGTMLARQAAVWLPMLEQVIRQRQAIGQAAEAWRESTRGTTGEGLPALGPRHGEAA